MNYPDKFIPTGGRLYTVFFLALAFISILPFLALSFYSHPTADDYVFSSLHKQLGWLEFQKYFYLKWQGLYTTNAIMCSPLSPIIHKRFDLYWIPCWLGLGSMMGSVWLLMKYLTRDKLAALVITCTVLVLYLYQLPNPTEALFWLNANWAYQMSISLGVLLLLLVMRTFQYEQVSRAYWAAAALLTVLLIGTNFIASLLTVFGVGVGTLLHLRNKTTRFWWIGLLLLAILAFGVVMVAPGNAIRLKIATETLAQGVPVSTGAKLVYSITHGVSLLLYSLINWFGNGVILALSVLLVPVLANVSANAEAPIDAFFKHWVVLVLAGAAMVAMPYFVTYITQGSPPAGRVLDLIYGVFILVWIFLLYAAVAWWRRAAPAAPAQPAYLSLAMGAFLVFALATDGNHALAYRNKGVNANNISLAYRDWFSGEAKRFDQQQRKRYQLMMAPGHAGVVLDSLSAKPPLIFLADLKKDSTNWTNQAYAKFFGKAFVRVH